jgi:hypothetical protein
VRNGARERRNGAHPPSGEHRIDIDEQRRIARLANSFPVLVQAPGFEIVGFAIDVGVRGLFVEADETLPHGTDVSVLLARLDGDIELRLPATVRRVDEHGFGLEFAALGAGETRALMLLLMLP